MIGGGKTPMEESITIRGLLVPMDWDEKGNTIEIAVSTYF